MEHHKRYTDKKRIYSGPYSDVYSATNGDTPVCLKVVDADIRLKPHDIKNEIRILKRLKHSAIIPILDNYEWLDDIVMITPLYKHTLNELLERKYSKRTVKHDLVNPINPPKVVLINKATDQDVLPMLTKLAGALEYIHSHEIIHRDIKPTNIFFMDDTLANPVIGDFGISYDNNNTVQIKDEPPEHKYTDVCSGIYKPVELCLGKSDYSYELDIWSLGITMSYVYSKSFRSIFDRENAAEAVVNDLSLINNTFEVLGTPHITPSRELNEKLYWPDMNNDKYYFKNLNFIPKAGVDTQVIFPLSRNEEIIETLGRMLVYDLQLRISSRDLFNQLSRIIIT